MKVNEKRIISRKKRARRVRKRVSGTAEKPRLCVRRSLNHIYAQIIDDVSGRSLIQVGSNSKSIAELLKKNKISSKSEKAKAIGEIVAEQALDKGIKNVVFDKKGYLFHGRVRKLVEGSKEKGLAF